MVAVEQGLVPPPNPTQIVRYPREATIDRRTWVPRPDGVLGIGIDLDSVRVTQDLGGHTTATPVHVVVSLEAYGIFSLGGELPASGVIFEEPRAV